MVGRPLRSDAERNRQRILAAAAEVFAQRGLDVGLEEIARHAGVGTATVYRRFPDKAQLIDALISQHIAGVAATVETARTMPDPWQGLVFLIESFVHKQTHDRALYELLFSNLYSAERLHQLRNQMTPAVTEILRRAQAAGTVRPDVEVTDLPVLQLMLGTVSSFATTIAPGLWQRQLGLLLDGLRTRRDSPTPLPCPPLSQDQLYAAFDCFHP